MSFSSDIKAVITAGEYKNSCCRRALLSAMLFTKADIRGACVELSLSDRGAVELSERLIKEFYSCEPTPSTSSQGGRRRLVSFKSKSCRHTVEDFNAGAKKLNDFIKCPACQSAILRGIFVSAGTVSNPNEQFCLELNPSFRENQLYETLSTLGIGFHISKKRQGDGYRTVLYTKRQSVIEDFFSMASLEQVTYDVINVGIQKEFNNRVNRLTNVEIKNIQRTVERSREVCELIRELIDKKLISSLSDELAYTARIRLEYADAPLTLLASYHTPPITKSGLSHRLSKIMKLGKELLQKK